MSHSFKQVTPMSMNYHQELAQKSRFELVTIQKISVAIKTLVSHCDYLTRTYAGPRSDTNLSNKANNNSSFIKNQKKGHSTSIPNIIQDENSK